MPRRRLSSDGFKLFNMAYSQPPTREGIRRFLTCLFHTEYDDRLEEMSDSCHRASKQLYAYSTDPIKKEFINKFIDNSIFNVIYAILCKDGEFATNFQMHQNYRYFMDVISEARNKGDHNTAIMLRAALDHHALKQKKFKLRSKDHEMIRQMEEEYGTWRNCYKDHLKMAMGTNDLGILPSMMVLQMHVARHKAYSTIGGCRLKYDSNDIKGKIGMYGIQHIQEQYNEQLPLYEEPPVNKSTDLIMLAQQAK